MSIQENLQQFLDKLKDSPTRLIAVSKTKPPEMLMEAYHTGFKRFGENKVQEMVDKYEQLPKDIEWHLIGNLQTNKVKYIAPFVHLIHSVDRLKVLREINKQAAKYERVIDCLLQIHIADEETKFGFSYEEAEDLLKSEILNDLAHIRLRGLMGMATFTENQAQIQTEFKGLKTFFERMKAEIAHPQVDFQELSMGMSGDYQIAMEEGSTFIRVGSAIFGARNYQNP